MWSDACAMTETQRAHAPMPDRGARFTPGDFSDVISHLPDECPVIGGQAVAWWAARYQLTGTKGEVITSADIDFWGSRDDLKKMAKGLRRKAIFPDEYEMTVWVGAIQLNIQGLKTEAEFLHTVPGLDTNDPDKASVEQEYRTESVQRVIQVLTPISLVLVKLHALRHFDQTDRQDELHLKVSLHASRRFLAQLLRQREIRHVLWNCERLIAAGQVKQYRKMATKYEFDMLGAIPIDDFKRAAADPEQAQEDQTRLANFVNLRWPRLLELKDGH